MDEARLGGRSVKVVLASESKYRRMLIEQLGMGVECVRSPFDEEAAKDGLAGSTAEQFVSALAQGKARAAAELHPDALVIGSDQAVDLDGELLGKPHTEERAREQLARLAGRAHRIVTAVTVRHERSGREETSVDVTELTVRALSEKAIADYVRRDQPLDCAGSYRLEALGIALFERVRSDDHTAVIGLPLMRLCTLLERFGVPVLGA